MFVYAYLKMLSLLYFHSLSFLFQFLISFCLSHLVLVWINLKMLLEIFSILTVSLGMSICFFWMFFGIDNFSSCFISTSGLSILSFGSNFGRFLIIFGFSLLSILSLCGVLVDALFCCLLYSCLRVMADFLPFYCLVIMSHMPQFLALINHWF